MALQSQVWSPATPMPMAESSLYRQRLEVIAEKRRLQEEIRAARGELEEEKLRVERLKRKSLRERWLMDGAEGHEGPEDATLQDPQSPEGQAQARIRNLEDSLFTLQSQLQLLQSASTGAQHKPSGRPTWRRQGHRPLSQPADEADQTDLNKRASLPAEPVGTSPEYLSESRDEAFGVLPASMRVPEAAGASPEANGPCPRPSPTLEQEQSQGVAASEGGVGEAKGGGVVKVVWEGLRATEDCAREATGPELEAKVEEMVLEAIGDRLEANHPELPSWVKEDRGVVEVVWEGVGGPEGSDSEAAGETGRGPQTGQTSSLKLQGGLEGIAAGGEGAPRGSPDGFRQGTSGGEEGSFIWVERVTLSEEWEELQVEGLEGPSALGREGGDESPWGVDSGRGGENWEVERRQAEESVGTGKKESEEKAGAEFGVMEMSLVVERKGMEEPLKPGRREGEGKVETEKQDGEEPLLAESKETEDPLRAERERGEEPLGVEQSGGEEKLEAEKEAEEPFGVESKAIEGSLKAEKKRGEEKLGAEKQIEAPLVVEKKGDEKKLEAIKEPLMTERKKGEESPTVEKTGDEEPLDAEKKNEESLKAERTGGKESLEAEKTQEVKEDVSLEEQRKSRGKEGQTEEVSEAGASLGAKEELRSEEEGPQQPMGAKEELRSEEEGPQQPVGAKEELRSEEEGPQQPVGAKEELRSEEEGPQQPVGAKEELRSEEKGPQQPMGAKEELKSEEEGPQQPVGAKEELRSEEEGPQQPQEKQKGSLEKEAMKPQTSAEGQDTSEDATPLLAETPAPEQPTECQPLLLVEEPRANPSAHPVPTYAPAQQPEPSAPPEGEEASGPKQKTCQCCTVM
ncbi:paralemmin 3 [Phyllostomus discolor]|uniref:Paralemmin 3 n=1 Tax=Phyllostomus discolor TaxID=89673 RepID=A0A7E6EAF3_9CHIR|nr:paralemmin-3 isoform X2 [Phyllostomus discolor]KAF6096004.1 paralemmin 3 [Phyllostomus discolor]